MNAILGGSVVLTCCIGIILTTIIKLKKTSSPTPSKEQVKGEESEKEQQLSIERLKEELSSLNFNNESLRKENGKLRNQNHQLQRNNLLLCNQSENLRVRLASAFIS